jgi:hypothetical protein
LAKKGYGITQIALDWASRDIPLNEKKKVEMRRFSKVRKLMVRDTTRMTRRWLETRMDGIQTVLQRGWKCEMVMWYSKI